MSELGRPEGLCKQVWLRASQVVLVCEETPETSVKSLVGQKVPEEGHGNPPVFLWGLPWTEQPGGPQLKHSSLSGSGRGQWPLPDPFTCRPVPRALWAGLGACQQTKFQYKWAFRPPIQDTSSHARTAPGLPLWQESLLTASARVTCPAVSSEGQAQPPSAGPSPTGLLMETTDLPVASRTQTFG